MEKLLKELVSMGEKITEYDKLADKIYGLNVDLSKVETSLDSLKTHSDNIEEDLKVFKNKDEDIADIRKQLNDMKDQLRHCKIELDKIVEYKSIKMY